MLLMDEVIENEFMEYWLQVVVEGLDDNQKNDSEIHDLVHEAFKAGWQAARYDEAQARNS